jgi:hypothetical protein
VRTGSGPTGCSRPLSALSPHSRPDHADRPNDIAQRPNRRRAPGRPACRPRDLPGLGVRRLVVPSKGIGLATSVASSLVGVWLGFHATTGLTALVTAILGAVAGANLVLMRLAMMWVRSAGDRVATGTAAETRSTGIELEASTGAGKR